MDLSVQEKRKRLKELMTGRKERLSIPDIVKRPTQEPFNKLSHNQYGLWFLSKLEGPNSAYNISVALELKGELNIEAMNSSIQAIIKRHEVLRTTFVEKEGVPFAVINNEIELDFKVYPASGLSLHDLCVNEAQKPFTIDKQSLIRIKIYEQTNTEHALVLNMHHIVSDGWSVGVILNEFVMHYKYYSGQSNQLMKPLEVSYYDYVNWQDHWFKKDVFNEQLEFWKTELDGLPPITTIPIDLPRPKQQRNLGKTVHFGFPKDLLNALNKFSRENKCTLYMVLIAALKVLLFKYTGQKDLAIGTGVSNRRKEQLNHLIGYFVNTLVVRSSVNDTLSFKSFLLETRKKVLNVFNHQDMPLQRIVEELKPERDMSYSPLFQILLTLQNMPGEQRTSVGELEISSFIPESSSAKTDLSISIQETVLGLEGSVEYRSDIYHEETIEYFLKNFEILLEKIILAPEKNIIDFNLVSDEDKKTMLSDWNNTTASYKDQYIHQGFEKSVIRHPNKIAVVHGDKKLTYAKLNEKSNQLARYLLDQKIQPGSLIGISMGRSIEMVVGMVAILKSACGYVPIDPEYPVERVKYIIDDANVQVVLINRTLNAKFSGSADVINLDMDKDQLIMAGEISEYKVDNIERNEQGVKTDDLAYIVYTSGSTAQPKGVMVTHKNVISLISDNKALALNKDSHVAMASNFAFDALTYELWGSLLNGAQLVVIDKQILLSPVDLKSFIETYEISVLFITTALFNRVAESQADCFSSLEKLFFGGEACSVPAIETILSGSPPNHLYHVYGPTECTTFSTYKLLNLEDITGQKIAPIGQPLSNTTTLVLNQKRKLTPISCVGELYIGGDGLAQGYLNREDLTTSNFVKNPFKVIPGERLYKTGDLVKQNRSGDIVFIGRNDNQIKYRGFRIELEEIESIITQLLFIQECSVILDDQHDNERLVAYVVINEDKAPAKEANWIETISSQIKLSLPEYMLPSAFVVLDAIPLNNNGKINRKLLPKPSSDDFQRIKYTAPNTDMERQLCQIWEGLLQCEKIGLNDNFFEVGGHSLLAMQLVTKVEQCFNKRLPMNQLFLDPTVLGVAGYLEGEEEIRNEHIIPKMEIDLDSRYEPFELTSVQYAYLIGRSNTFDLGNISTHAYVEINIKKLDVSRLQRTWNKMIKRHEMLRTTFTTDGQQRILAEVPEFQINYKDLSLEKPEVVEKTRMDLRAELSHQMFDVEEWPLFDIQVIQAHSNDYRLYFSLDALISDHMSSMIMVDELDRMYANEAIELPVLNASFRDYVNASGLLENTALYEQSKQYWESRINSLPATPDLPMVKHPKEVEKPEFERQQAVIDESTWKDFKTVCQNTGVTPSVLLITLFSKVIRRWSKHESFCLNLTLFNRIAIHEQIDSIVGDFTSLSLLEVHLKDNLSLAQNAKNIQKQLWNDIEHRYFDGVDVLRLMNREKGGKQAVMMPVVFTSALESLHDESDDFQSLLPELSNLSSDNVYGVTQTSQVWLDNVVQENKGKLVVNWDFVVELFPDNMIETMFEAYIKLITDLAGGNIAVNQVHSISIPKAQSTIREITNATNDESLGGGLLHHLFINQVTKNPDNTAIITADLRISYKQLDKIAKTLANQIIDIKGNFQPLVAIVMEKGWEQVAAVLAVLYTGAAYLPIDATQPLERTKLLLQQGECSTILLQEHFKDTLSGINADFTVMVKADPYFYDKEYAPITIHQSPDDLAYVIFTSGSTGVPKGVMIDHKGAVNTVLDINEKFQVTSKDKSIAISSLNFDLSVYDIFGLLAAGGSIVIPEAQLKKEPSHWAQLVFEHEISIWNTVPALAQIYIEEVEKNQLNNFIGENNNFLITILLSGDWIPLDLPERIKNIHKKSDVISLGGATEASIWSIYYPVDVVQSHWKSIPYGKPLKNQQFFVLNELYQHTPDWVVGDLYIGGIGLAKGYWNDLEKTTNSFITHPENGKVLYRTGDIGRMLPDGNIEFLGREDNQIKVYGHRIELGEIESTIVQNRLVKDVVVTAHGEHQNKRLVAFVVPNPQSVNGEKGNLNNEQSFILDENERIAFKFKQQGKRYFTQEHKRHQLPSSSDDSSIVSQLKLAFDSEVKPTQCNHISSNEFGSWLDALKETKVSDFPIGKRFYPSAGSLYPVQTYVYLSHDFINGFEAGFYYYDSSSHSLILINSALQINISVMKQGFMLLLVSDKRAIAPLYGDNSNQFSLIESGHISELLSASAHPHKILLSDCKLANINALTKGFDLNENHQFQCAFKGMGCVDVKDQTEVKELGIFERQSYRNFVSKPIEVEQIIQLFKPLNVNGLKIYILIRPQRNDSISDIKAWCLHQGKLEPLTIPSSDSDLDGHGYYADAAFDVYIMGNKDSDSNWIDAGVIGQKLMNMAPALNIGLCPIGEPKIDQLAALYTPAQTQNLMYGFEGGVIDPKQTQQWEHQSSGITDPTEELKQFLQQRLPYYMVPSIFIPLEELPLTANGKVDRNSLPDIEDINLNTTPYVAPQNDIEHLLCEIWEQILDVEKIGIDDNFFEIGGDSLSATRFITQVRNQMANNDGVGLKLASFFEEPTIRKSSQDIQLQKDAIAFKKNKEIFLNADQAMDEGEI